LETLPRIGPALAQRILDWREANGRFVQATDLLKVSGIGQKLFDGLKDRVTV
jgi:competence protein ComEA